MTRRPVRLVVSDVDGTLVTPDKVLTARAVAAVTRLRDHGVHFAITSGRPPLGMRMLVEPLGLTTPVAAFNGGVVVSSDLQETLVAQDVPANLVDRLLDRLEEATLGAWMFSGPSWFVTDLGAPHVAREMHSLQFEPTVVTSLRGRSEAIAKIVGVSDDPASIARAHELVAREADGEVAASSSQTYYLDITNRNATKGWVVDYLCQIYGVDPAEVVTIGDGANDVDMFARSGHSIAMGNAPASVRAAAAAVTASNADEGFALAMEGLDLSPA